MPPPTREVAVLRIRGAPEALAAAKVAIAALLKLDGEVGTLRVPSSALGMVIGKGGASLKRTGDTHGVVITTDNATGVLTLRGPAAGIEAAKKALLKRDLLKYI